MLTLAAIVVVVYIVLRVFGEYLAADRADRAAFAALVARQEAARQPPPRAPSEERP